MRRVLRLIALSAVLVLLPVGPAHAIESWRSLRRPLQLPTVAPGQPCPVSAATRIDANAFGTDGIGRGPAYPMLGAEANLPTRPRGEWLRGKLFWYVAPRYGGRVLARGHRLDAYGPLRLEEGRRELRIDRGETVTWDRQPRGSRGAPTSAMVKAAGCYGVQIDGKGFSRTVVFTVTTS
jgi:hypothetical protein